MQKYRITPKQSIYTLFVCLCQSRGKKPKSWFLTVEKSELHWWLRPCLHSFCKMSRPKNFFNENYFKMRGYSCWWTGRCSVMQPPCYPSGKNNNKRSSEQTFSFPTYSTSIVLFNNLPCIQNQRNPGLLCRLWIRRLWIRLWNRVEHPGVARKSLCSAGALGLHGAPWSLDRGNPLFPDCVWEGCRMSRNSFVFPLPRSTSAPWHKDKPVSIWLQKEIALCSNNFISLTSREALGLIQSLFHLFCCM